jgi:hypothetical protein
MIDYQTLCQAIEYWKQGGTPSDGVAEEIVEEVDSGLVEADELEDGEGDGATEDEEQDSVDSGDSMDSGEHATESDGDGEAESSDDDSYDSDDR